MASRTPPPPPHPFSNIDTSFLTKYCQIDDKEASERVAKTIETVQASLHVYRCIERAAFTTPRIQNHPVYRTLQSLKQQEISASSSSWKVLELGCCLLVSCFSTVSSPLPKI